jgi:nucleoside-diphosphate-sugar epimerase
VARVLITGGSGFIGTNLVGYLHARGDAVVSLDSAPPRNPEHARLWRKVSVLDRDELRRTVAEFNPEFVYHLAARADLDGRALGDYEVNTLGVSNLIDAVRGLRDLRFVVLASSMLVCRIGYAPRNETDYCPSTFYGESKVESEKLVRREATGLFPWTIVRPTSIWGPWFGAPYRDFFEAVRRGVYLHPRGRRIRRSYGFVLNTVAQLERIAGSGQLAGRTIYLADYEPVELWQWSATIQRHLGARPVREVPLWMLKLAAQCGDAAKRLGYRAPPITSFRLNNLMTEMIHDTGPLRAVCSEVPYSMEQGVDITCEWLRSQPA